MIEFVSGNFFEFNADIMINTVNCVGVMGAGVALAFKKRYPEMFENYVEQCRSEIIQPGKPTVWIQGDMFSKEIEIINFPTKDHWKNPSEYHYIEDGLTWLSTYLENKSGMVVTLPALGCGHGGLDWNIVRTMISDKLKNSPAHIYVFEPHDSVKVGHIDPLSSDYEMLLSSVGGGVIRYSSDEYPKALRCFTKKNLYYFPQEQKNFQYDYSIICSSKPEAKEISALRKFIEFCIINKFNVLFGGTAFEKKIAFEYSDKGLICGCILPSGIYESVKKILSTKQKNRPNILSIGNPLTTFDKKEFMPSVFARIYLSKKVFFFANNLTWLIKYKKDFKRIPIEASYFLAKNRTPEDIATAKEIGAKEFDFISRS